MQRLRQIHSRGEYYKIPSRSLCEVWLVFWENQIRQIYKGAHSMFHNLLAMHRVMYNSRLSWGKLRSAVHRALNNVLVSAYLNVPYYRELMRSARYNPLRDYRGPKDLSRLPVTDKETIKREGANGFTSRSRDISGLIYEATSGTTGIPIEVYRSPYERSLQIAKWLRVLFVNGYSVRDRVVSLTEPTKLGEGKSFLQRFGFLRRLTLDYTLDCRRLADILLEEKPDVLYGNRSHLELMALELKKRGIRLHDLKLVVATGEIISDRSRRLCRQIYGVDLTESYGSVEMGVMAYETPTRDGLQLCEDMTYFEFLDDAGQPVNAGEPGRVVVTDLTGKTMPFIRYDHGDQAVFKIVPDEQGNKIRRITKILGRDDDYAMLPDGSVFTYHIFYELMAPYPEVYQYRIIQQRIDRFQLLIVSDPSYFEAIRAELLDSLYNRFPPDISFDIAYVDRLDLHPSGKLKKFIFDEREFKSDVPLIE